MVKNQLRYTRWRALFYPLTALAAIGLSTPLQADAPVQLKAEQSGAKYGAVASFCDVPENTPRSDTCGMGYSNNHVSQEEANQQAIKKCGVSGCEVIIKLTNACGVLADGSDTWEYNGKTVGYSYSAWSDQGDALKYPLLADLEKFMIGFCNSFVQDKAAKMPGYTFKPCVILESSCPTPSPAPAKKKGSE
ncbi:DUF4189 domain-containing protein [Candidatus Parabeggiatoa sp. HSG14]|uniref:DUF4189 domain-containing protein n=1 Tax=Candidatus Parabeggiatoa sp. HSG14 TaxID=3055593 RepID=UPI0025A8EBF2|nr:DUF4189 domain-containing protein [Thiotrichales bacterium HSG14]